MLDVHVSGVPERVPPGCYPLVLWRLSDDSARDAICVEGSVHTAGAILEWLVELGVIASASEVDALASSVPDAAGVAFVPALQGLGSPWLDDGARGLVIGLTRGTTRAHLVRAALEGIAARCADLCEALAVEGPTLPVDGGLANSNVLLQCIADRTGLVVERAAELETTALGAALLAGLAVGVLPDLRACAATRRVGTRFTPRTTHAERTALRHHWRRTVARARTP
jgi:glycerol kinase